MTDISLMQPAGMATNRSPARAVVVGASAGALDALFHILPPLPASFPLPIIVVVHLPPNQDSLLAGLLQARCPMRVREAEDKEPLTAGVVFIAPPDYHLLVEKDERLSLSSDEAVNYSRPSIDVLFETAADAFGPGLIGVVLTGANDDGARGLRAIIDAGGEGLVQNPDCAYASAMPSAAIALCPEAQRFNLNEIASYLMNVARTQ